MNRPSDESSVPKKIASSIWLGVPRASIGFLVGHPLDVVKTRMQANPTYSKFAMNFAAELYVRHGGVTAFYKGGVPNFTRTILKEVYRSPGRGFFYHFFSNNVGFSGTKANTLTGLAMALADNAIAMPMERLKVWLMTVSAEQRGHVLIQFFTNHPSGTKAGMIGDLYKGFSVASLRSCISWWSYLIPEHHLRSFVVSRAHLDKNNVSIGWNSLIGMPCGFFNGVCTLPFDTVKSQMQKFGNNKYYTIHDMFCMGRQLVETHGFWRGLYSGFNVRLLHYVIIGALTGNIIPQVDKIWAKK